MRRSIRIPLTCLVGVIALAHALVPGLVSGARAQSALPGSLTHTAIPHARTLTPVDWNALNLGRAVGLWSKGDVRGAVALLETIDISRTSAFAGGDRAAFLLAAAYLQLGDDEAFHRVAARAADATGSPYRRWIRYCQLAQAHNDDHGGVDVADHLPTGFPGTEILATAILMELGQTQAALALLEASTPNNALTSIHLYLQALASEALGADADATWERLAKREPRNELESELVATAILRVATALIESGSDASNLLRRVPEQSRLSLRATHILGLIALEKGDFEAGHRILEELVEEHPEYEARREVKLHMGGLAMDLEHWQAALRYFERAEGNWIDTYTLLARLDNDTAVNDVWRVWEDQRRWREEIRLAPEALLVDVAALAETSLDLRGDPPLTPRDDLAGRFWPSGDGDATAAWDSAHVLDRHFPTTDEWAALRAAQRERHQTETLLARQAREVEDRRQEVARRLHYIGDGNDRTAASTAELMSATQALEAMLAQLDLAVSQLEAVRDSSLLDIARRTRDMTEDIRQELLFIHAMRHFHVEGPGQKRPEVFPEGVPSPADLLVMAEGLTLEVAELVTLFAQHYPGVIARSFAEVWEPRLTGDTRSLHTALMAELDRARSIGAALDSSLAFYASDPQLAAAIARRDELAAMSSELREREHEVRRDIARAVAARGREQLAAEREAIDYHLADAAYEHAVAMATDTTTSENAEIVVPSRKRAIERVEAFLDRYPESIARGESRYRLADLRLMQARDDFQTQMASFLGDAPTADDLQNRALAPFVDYAPAIALYEAILTEDGSFPHLDAVLFNLGMILSDDGRPEADGYLARLVQGYPESPDCQEAWLRMGSDRFDRKDFAGCATYFEQAIAGDDPSFAAIALYKLGWANFEEDQFLDSADAFRRLLDLYATHSDVARAMDLRDEAEEYLVHSLGRSGGADAFRDYFDSLGGRDYEARILISLGHLMRSISLYEEAVACDELWLARYGDGPRALAVVQRLVDTYRSWNKPDAAREAKLSQAERFLPGSAWLETNDDDELRVEAHTFAGSAYREAAAHHHQQARKTDASSSWQSALSHYERYLTHWPQAADADRMHYLAGETATKLNRYDVSLRHYAVASESDSTELANGAFWQRVAVTDTWYRTSRPAGAGTGNDSLAVVLLTTGDRFIERFPDDERCADILWRQGNVAYAHGWYEGAATVLSRLNARYPADERAPRAIRMAGDAHYQREAYDAAGAAYEVALERARAEQSDSLVVELESTIPLCYYKHAEGIAAADEKNGEKEAAPLFARVAQRWPAFKHADLALYRAGLGFSARKSYADAAAAWEHLLAGHPKSEYARDSAVQIAQVHEKSGNKHSAARAYERFSKLYPSDAGAADALLKSIDLLVEAKDEPGAEEMRDIFLERFPGETETVMEIRAARAARELAAVASGTSTLAVLLGSATVGVKAGAQGAPAASQLESYLELAAKNPELASPELLAQVDYFKAEDVYPKYAAMRLTQPLPKALEAKRKKLEELMKMYDRCAAHGITEYAHASAHRIGQVLVEFGDALVDSERPGDLSEDDLYAYDDVLIVQSWEFYDRGMDVWAELIKQAGAKSDDPGEWVARTREALWPRLSRRFLYQPEVDYPLVAATPPPKTASE